MKKFILLKISLFAFLFSAKSQNLNTNFRSMLSYPNETLANVWGYWTAEKEYALVGAAKGMSIVDITDPVNPVKIVQIPGPNNLWKEIKTFQHFAYVVSEGGFGVQIIDLQNLPSANLPYKSYKGDGAILNTLNKAHALHIDTEGGFLYVYGSNLYGGGPVILNLLPDPWNPVFVGKFDALGYVHDGFVERDTLFSSHIYDGQFAIVDVSDKSNPKVLNIQKTPGQFTHNTWLTNDRKTLFATDEVNNSWLSAYDVSQPDDIKLLDLIKSNAGSNSMVHNTYVLNDFAITSWYKDGFTIVDITDPSNLVQVGNYDTHGGTGGGSDGCWGVFPYFPSGNIIASNIRGFGNSNGELLVISPNYVRAGRLEGKITDGASGQPLSGVKVEILNTNILETTIQTGIYKMGLPQSERLTVRYSKSGFQTFEQEVFFQNGQKVVFDVELFPIGNLTVTGKVVSGKSGNPIENAQVSFTGVQNFTAQTDAGGNFQIQNVGQGIYDVSASSPTGGSTALIYQQKIMANKDFQISVLPQRVRNPIKIRH